MTIFTSGSSNLQPVGVNRHSATKSARAHFSCFEVIFCLRKVIYFAYGEMLRRVFGESRIPDGIFNSSFFIFHLKPEVLQWLFLR